MKLPKGVELFGGTVVFTQDIDSNGPDDPCQVLTVRVEDASRGMYMVIETTRWALDTPADLTALLQRVATMFEETHP